MANPLAVVFGLSAIAYILAKLGKDVGDDYGGLKYLFFGMTLITLLTLVWTIHIFEKTTGDISTTTVAGIVSATETYARAYTYVLVAIFLLLFVYTLKGLFEWLSQTKRGSEDLNPLRANPAEEGKGINPYNRTRRQAPW